MARPSKMNKEARATSPRHRKHEIGGAPDLIPHRYPDNWEEALARKLAELREGAGAEGADNG